MTRTAAVRAPTVRRDLRAPVAWGVVGGVIQAATPLAFFWLDAATVYALGLALIAAVYIGFAVADGRRHVLAVETAVASAFLVVAAAAVTGSAWLMVAGLAGHGLKDMWQHHTGRGLVPTVSDCPLAARVTTAAEPVRSVMLAFRKLHRPTNAATSAVAGDS